MSSVAPTTKAVITADDSLHQAVIADNLVQCQALVQQGADVNAKNYYHETPLFHVKSLEVFEYLVSQGGDVKAKTVLDGSILHNIKCLDVIKILVEIHGLDPKGTVSMMKSTVLQQEDLPLETMKYYVETCGLDPKVVNCYNDTAARYNCCSKNLDTLKYLVETCGVDPIGVLDGVKDLDVAKYLVEEKKVTFTNGFTKANLAMLDTVKYFHEEIGFSIADSLLKDVTNFEVGKYLLEKGLKPSKKAFKNAVLYRASVDLLNLYLESDPEVFDKEAFFYSRNPETIEFFMDYDITSQDLQRLANTTFDTTIIKYLVLNHDVDPSGPLVNAAMHINPDFVKFLFEQGAKPSGEELLFCKNPETIKVLLDAMPDDALGLDFVDDVDGCGPLHWGAKSWSPEKIKVLLDYGANINAQDKNGRTALHYGCRNGLKSVVKILIDSGIDYTIKDKDGEEALHYAKHGDVAQPILLKMNKRF